MHGFFISSLCCAYVTDKNLTLTGFGVNAWQKYLSGASQVLTNNPRCHLLLREAAKSSHFYCVQINFSPSLMSLCIRTSHAEKWLIKIKFLVIVSYSEFDAIFSVGKTGETKLRVANKFHNHFQSKSTYKKITIINPINIFIEQ